MGEVIERSGEPFALATLQNVEALQDDLIGAVSDGRETGFERRVATESPKRSDQLDASIDRPMVSEPSLERLLGPASVVVSAHELLGDSERLVEALAGHQELLQGLQKSRIPLAL